MKYLPLLAVLGLSVPVAAMADDRPDAHAPIGVMADHTHHKGEFMFSYRFQHMDMGGNRIGTTGISPDQIVTTIPNRFLAAIGQPPTLRIVPLEMTMDMHMAGFMYAPTDWVTLMAMGMVMTKDMRLRTYQGGLGTTVLGDFKTGSDGFGDTSVMALLPVVDRADLKINIRAGLSLPTGSTTEIDTILTPMNMTPTVRLPYAMQLGSGTWDLLPGVTIKGRQAAFGWGLQYQGTLRTGTNGQGYRLGDSHMVTGWVSYMLAPWISTSARLAGRTTGRIHGIDPAIVGPVQTADPNDYGGDRADGYLGVNLIAPSGPLEGYRLGIELGAPFYQKLNGPQMKEKWQLTVGVQKAF